MTDRDRLIELFSQFADGTYNSSGKIIDGTKVDDVVDYLLANGVIFPPVEVGDTVWYVDDFMEEIEECTVYGFNVVNGKLSLLVDNGECKFITRKWHNTKEEAEQKLKELGK